MASPKCRGDCASAERTPGTALAMAPTYGTNVPRKVSTASSSQPSIPASARPTAVNAPISVIATMIPPTHLRSPPPTRVQASSNVDSWAGGIMLRTPRRYTSGW